MSQPEVRIYEVGPRDGLQAEHTVVPLAAKLRFIALLADAGLRDIEATSLVRPERSPSSPMPTTCCMRLDRRPGVRYPVLVPNPRGLERAVGAGVDAICLFTAASDATRSTTSRCRSPSRWPRSGRSPRRRAVAAGGCAATSAAPSAVPTRARSTRRPWCASPTRCWRSASTSSPSPTRSGVAAPTDVDRVMDALRDGGIPLDALGVPLP